MSQQQGLQQQLAMAQAQILQLSQQLLAERETAQRNQSQLQKQLEQQQQQLAKLEAKEIIYRQQFDCNPQPMWIFDLETLHFLKVNDAAIAKYGYSRDEFLSMTIADIRSPEDVPRLLSKLDQVDSGLDQAGIWRHCLRNGQIIYVEITSYGIEFEGRRAKLVMAQDVTDRRQAQFNLTALNQELENQVIDRTADLAASEARLNILLNANPATIYSCEPHGNYVCRFISKNVETLLEYTPEEFYASPDFWIQCLHPDDVARVFSEIPDLLEHGTLKHEYRLHHRDGHYVWVYDESTLLRDDVGQPLEIFGFITDISDRKKAESQIKQLLSTIETAIDGIGITQNNIFTYANRAQLDMFGYSADELIGQPWTILYSADEVARLEREAVPVFIRDHYWLGDVIAIRKDGTTFHQELSLTLSEDGITIGVSKNISERKRVEMALRDSEMRYITLAQTAPVGIFRFDLNGNCIYVNEGWCKMTGKPSTFALNNQWLETIHPDDVTYTQTEVQRWLQSNDGTLFQNEARILRDDGSIVWFYCQLHLEFNANGQTIGYVGTLTDISDRKQKELELIAYAEQVEDLYNNAPCGYCSLNSDNRITQINNTALIWLDYLREEVLRQPITQFMTSTSQRIFAERHNLIKQSGHRKSLHYEIVLIGSDGGQMTTLFSDEAQQDAEGNILGHRITITDIRHRVKAEKLLQQQLTQANLLRQITTRIRQSLDLTTIFNTTCNELQQALHADRVAIFQFYPTSNFNDGEFIAESLVRNYPSVLRTPIHDHCFGDNFANLYAQGKYHAIANIQEINLSPCYADILRQFQILANLIVPLLDSGNRLWGLLCIHQCAHPRSWHTTEIDLVQHLGNQLAIAINQAKLFEKLQQELGDRQLAEQELEERNQQLSVTNTELERATRLKDEFLANMSHELRTPLNAILGMSESLQDEIFGSINEGQLKALRLIENSGNHLLTLINDILDLAKIAAGEMKLEFSSVDVEQICSSAITFVKQQAHNKQIRLDTEIPPNLTNLYIDEVRIRQVLLNLLTNAVKFTPEGGSVKLVVSFVPPEPNTDQPTYLRFSITDTGIGISPENISQLFKPFVQIDSALNRKQMGTGLGLALVKQMVELHGGQVGLSSEFGIGSCFTVELPYSPEVSIPVQTQAIAPDIALSQPSNNTSSYLILLAEDNLANVATISNYLEVKGYRMILANNGQEAIDLARSHQPDLILMDIQMPEIDGLEAIKQIRQQESLRTTPIIALTALTMQGDRDRCLAVGANEYLSKPVKLKHLHTLIKELLWND